MGALFFMLFMAIVFFIALGGIILNTILIKITKHIVFKILLVISVIVILIPIGFIVFLRFANSQNRSEIVYAESGKVIYWGIRENSFDESYFEMDNIKYIIFRKGFKKDSYNIRFNEDSFFIKLGEEQRGEPAANIKDDPSIHSSFDKFMTLLLTGKSIDKQNTGTIYPVTTDNGFEYYDTNRGSYMSENKLNSLKAYYGDFAVFDTQNLICRSSVYTDDLTDNEAGSVGGKSFINIEKEVTLNPGVFEELFYLPNSGQNIQRFEVPQKYKDAANTALPGTPIDGYDELVLIANSKDNLAFIENHRLVLIEEQVYVVKDIIFPNSAYLNGCPLFDEMNLYIRETLFMELY